MLRRIGEEYAFDLSPRELQLMKLAARGLTDQAIANELGISLATIATYWGRIRIKFGPLNRTELVANYLNSIASKDILSLEVEISILRGQLSEKGDLGTFADYLNKLPTAVYVFDGSGTLIYVNKETCDLLQFTHDELINRHISEFYPESRIEVQASWLANYLIDPSVIGKSIERQIYLRSKSGVLDKLLITSLLTKSDDQVRVINTARKE
jgi:PAS domain S-box-containing protein